MDEENEEQEVDDFPKVTYWQAELGFEYQI